MAAVKPHGQKSHGNPWGRRGLMALLLLAGVLVVLNFTAQLRWMLTAGDKQAVRGVQKATAGSTFPIRQPKVGEWRVVAPKAAVTALAAPSGPIDWSTVCAGTASQQLAGSPRIDGTDRVAGGAVFQGDAIELFRQQRAGLCVLLLHHASLVDDRGAALPTADIAVGVQPWFMPRGDPFASSYYYTPWDKYRAGHPEATIIDKSHVSFTYRSRSSITVVRDAVLWDRALTFSKAASFGGGGCQSWEMLKSDMLVSHAKYDRDTESVTLDGSRGIPHFPGTVLHMPQYWLEGFYHWIIEGMPRLWVAKQLLARDPSIRVSVASAKTPFAAATLRLLGITNPTVHKDRYTADWAIVPAVTVCGLAHGVSSETYTAATYMLGSALLEGVEKGVGPGARLQKWIDTGTPPSQSEVGGGSWPLPPPGQATRVTWVHTGDEAAMAGRLVPALHPPASMRYFDTRDLVADPKADLAPHASPLVDWPRTEVVAALDAAVDGGAPLVILLHRPTGRRRWLANEGAVAEAIRAALPWAHVVMFGSADLEDAAVLWRAAALVVVPHGAGLSNIIFSRPGTPVVEVLAAKSPGSPLSKYPWVYMDLMGGLGHPYFPLVTHETSNGMEPPLAAVTAAVKKAWPLSWWHSRQGARE